MAKPQNPNPDNQDGLDKSVSDDMSKAARVVKADRLRLPQNVKVIRPSDIKAMVDRMVAEITSAEQGETVAKMAEMELKINSLQNKLIKVEADRDALAALAADKEKSLEELQSSTQQEKEALGSELSSMREQVEELARSRDSEAARAGKAEEELDAARNELSSTKSDLEEELSKAREELESTRSELEKEVKDLQFKFSETQTGHEEELEALNASATAALMVP